jgi:hypothetical protein
VIKLKITKKKIIVCGVLLFILFYAYIGYLFKKENEEKNKEKEQRIERRIEKLKEIDKEIEIKKAEKLEEYLKNKKSPSEYLSLFGNKIFYFAAYSQSSSTPNGLYEVEIINNVPVLHRIEFINGEKIKIYDIILDEQFDNPYLPTKAIDKWAGLYNCDFAFFNRYSADKDNLDNISSYLKFLEEDGEIKIWARDGSSSSPDLIYKPQSLENILKTFNNPKKEIKYTGKYRYEKIEIIKKFDRKNPNYTPKTEHKEICITYTGTNQLIMYYDNRYYNEDDWHYIYIDDIDNPHISLLVADGGGSSTNIYYYIYNDYLKYHLEHSRYNMNTDIKEYDIEYNVYYKKTANGK